MNGKLITIEGISGIGKSFYFNELEKKVTNSNVIFNKEITNDNLEGINKKIFEILTSTNNPFFDLGNPKMETLLIASKQANDEEYFILPSLLAGKSVISDRGYDTICILEGILFSLKYGRDPLYYSNEIYNKLSFFNRIPDKTILLVGNVDEAIKRAEFRNKKTYNLVEKDILKKSYELFIEFSKMYSDRFEIIDVDLGYENTIKKIMKVIKKEGIIL